MIRLSIIIQDNFITLGANGLASFIEAGGTDKINSVQHIDDDFMKLAEAMRVSPYGFTEEFKVDLLALLQAHKGQQCLVTTHWILKRSSPKSNYLMGIVEKINKGEPLTAAEEKKIGIKSKGGEK